MDSIIFEKDEKIKEIQLKDLQRTQSLAEFNGNLPSNKPVEHYNFISELQEQLDKNNVEHTLDPIMVSKSHMKTIPFIQKQYDNEHCIESYLFQRLISRIQLKGNYNNDLSNTSIGIGYDIRGITLAIGTNVHLCRNMCIMGMSNLSTTFGNNKMPFDKLMKVFLQWISELSEQRTRDTEILQKMEDVDIVGKDAMAELIGNMELAAVNSAYINQKESSPLNITQVSDFAKRYITSERKDDITKLIDAYNIGTNILTHNKHNIENKWESIMNFSNFIINRYGLVKN